MADNMSVDQLATYLKDQFELQREGQARLIIAIEKLTLQTAKARTPPTIIDETAKSNLPIVLTLMAGLAATGLVMMNAEQRVNDARQDATVVGFVDSKSSLLERFERADETSLHRHNSQADIAAKFERRLRVLEDYRYEYAVSKSITLAERLNALEHK